MNHERLVERVEALIEESATFELDGVTYTVGRQSLQTWLRVLVALEPDSIVPGLLDPAAQAELYEQLTDPDSPLEVEVVEAIGCHVLQTVAGRPWWEAQRAVLTGLTNWNSLDGWATHECGVDLLSLNLARFCNLVVRWCLLTRADEDERDAWLTGFESPPPGSEEAMEHRPEWADEELEQGFEDAMGDWAAITGALSLS